jgi:pimeloyl-ACP methyl ester carboxylesterase
VTGAELVSRGVLPGKALLDQVDGACSVPVPPLEYAPLGPWFSGAFYSRARRRSVGYTIAYPPGHRPGDELPLVVMLHGFGGNHTDALAGMSPAQAVALRVNGQKLAPMAMVTVDGGGGYWTPHPGDDPMAMVISELIPRCQRLGLGRPPRLIGIMGISMGGYGALLFAEKYPHLIAVTAAISPAIWTSYAQANAANPSAYASAAAFDANDAVTHTASLAGLPSWTSPKAATPDHSSSSKNPHRWPSSPATSRVSFPLPARSMNRAVPPLPRVPLGALALVAAFVGGYTLANRHTVTRTRS